MGSPAAGSRERQFHVGGRGLQRAGLDLPDDLDNASVGGRRITAPLALLDDAAVDHINLAGAALQKVLQHGVTAAARTDMTRERIEQLLGRPVGAGEVGRVSPKIGSTGWPRSWPTRIASSPISMISSRMPGSLSAS